MIIGIDANEANTVNRVGIGQYALNILKNIIKLDKKNKYYLYLKDKPLSDLPRASKHLKYVVFGPKKLWTKFALPIKLFTQFRKPDLFFSPSHYGPFLSPVPTIVSIMDLGFLRYPEQFSKKDLFQLTSWTENSVKKAKHIITISQFTKEEIINHYRIPAEKITIAYPSLTKINVRKAQVNSCLHKFKIDCPFFLYVGTLKPSKNIPFLIRAFHQFRKSTNYKLVIAGKHGWMYDQIFKLVDDLGENKNIIFTNYISEKDKWCLYKSAISLVMPSLYEGFGIPVIEAQSSGTPIITSNTTSLPEIVADSGICIDPSNLDSLEKAMHSMTNTSTRSKYAKLGLSNSRKFQWEKSAKKIISVFDKIST